jgi:hypothetical protein
MPIYDKPTKILMREFAAANLKKGQSFSKDEAVNWFRAHYPKIQPATVGMHVEAMSVNSRLRKHHPSVRSGSQHDVFFKLGPGQYRLWEPDKDPAPTYKSDLIATKAGLDPESDLSQGEQGVDDAYEAQAPEGAKEFAFERDLRNYLSKNLGLIEPGLRLYEEEEITGIEFPVGGRFIDILAVDKAGGYVVIELKVSRGYDRTIGQLLRYMSWIQKNLAEQRKVRGVIVAGQITDDLMLAASWIPDVKLVEYEISFSIKPIREPR